MIKFIYRNYDYEELDETVMNFFKSLFVTKTKNDKTTSKNNSDNKSLDKLIDGELPWGWHYATKDFTDKIRKEYSYFLDTWINSKTRGIKEEYSSLKSFVLYMYDVRKLVYPMNECFVKWYDDIIGDNYLSAREKELKHIEENFNQLLQEENQRKEKERLIDEISTGLDVELLSIIQNNPGILQSDIYGKYDPVLKEKISEILYFINRDGKIIREQVEEVINYILIKYV